MSVNVPPRSIQNCQPGFIASILTRCNNWSLTPIIRSFPMIRLKAVTAAFAAACALGAAAQTKWDMPTPYAATNFHTENVAQFAADVEKATGGKLKIQVHPNASLFKANEIKRAVQGGQAQVGEILLSGYSNEDPLFGLDSVPFLATSYGDAEKLWKASKKGIE